MSKSSSAKKVMMEVVEEKLPIVIDANHLYNEFIGLTHIERTKEEDFVLRSLLRGHSRNHIMQTLKKKYPDVPFSSVDLEKFIAKNQTIVRAMGQEVRLSAKRLLAAKEQCSETLAGLALYTQKLVIDFRAEGDNTNTVAAIRALNTTLENYMKLEGMLTSASDKGPVVSIVNQVSHAKARLKDRVHNADFMADIEVQEDNGKI